MILVTGAGGKTGNALIKALAARGEPVHAFVHREAHVESVRALGAVVISAGALDDVDAIARAAKGSNAVYHICPNVNPFEFTFARAVMEAATRAGLRRVIYHSVLHPQTEAMPHHWQKLRVEEMLLGSGLDVTILQPTAYMQNILASWPMVTVQGIFRVPYPASTRISLVDLDDVAAAAAIIVKSNHHTGATYELVGTPPLSQDEVAHVMSMVLRKPVRVEHESADAWAVRARAAGIGDYQCDTLLKMYRYYEQFGLIGNPNALTWLLGRAPTPLASFIARAAGRDMRASSSGNQNPKS
jgi:uncharacterized protein YbjT (DUF2867 family)